MHVLIIGGYGGFGYRIAKLLADEIRLTITLAGRSLDKAIAGCEDLSGETAFRPLRLDRTLPLAPQIETPPNVIIDAAGPFQAYDVAQNPVTDYVMAAGCAYLDLSDNRDFCEAVCALDTRAKAVGATLITGLSTYPVLTAAALKALENEIGEIHEVKAGIAPSPQAPMGRNVLAAITSYAGRESVGVWRDGRLQNVHGLTETWKTRIAPPGVEPLPNLVFSVVDAPDASQLPQEFSELKSVWNGAGPRPVMLHRILITLSRLAKWKLFPPLRYFTGLILAVQNRISFGAHRGGMVVTASNAVASASWHLIAEGDDGPNIPAIPCVVMIKKWLRGEAPQAGARTAIADFTLADFDTEFSKLRITHGMRRADNPAISLFENVLGGAYAEQAPKVQALHRIYSDSSFTGRAKITRGRYPLANLVASVFRFPKSGEDIPVTVNIKKSGRSERWERHFSGRKMQSEFSAGPSNHTVIERFGPIAVQLAVSVADGRQYLKPIGWTGFGIPLPKFWLPFGEMYEFEAEGRFNFHVDICVPLLGRLVKYEGWLVPRTEE